MRTRAKPFTLKAQWRNTQMQSYTHSCYKKSRVPAPKMPFIGSPAKNCDSGDKLLINTRSHQFCQNYHSEHVSATSQKDVHVGILKCLLSDSLFCFSLIVNCDSINTACCGTQHLNVTPGKAAQSSYKHRPGVKEYALLELLPMSQKQPWRYLPGGILKHYRNTKSTEGLNPSLAFVGSFENEMPQGSITSVGLRPKGKGHT